MPERIQLKEISPRAWEHPADRAALAALKALPGVDVLIRKFIGLTSEKQLRMMALGNAVRVTPNQFPRMYKLVEEASHVLDAQEIPEVYVSNNPQMNAMAVGADKPFLVFHSAIIDAMDDDELIAIIGHELGHCLSGHVLYKTLLRILINLSQYAFQIPISGIALWAILAALYEWDRKSELSADRAGLLVSQNPEKSYTVLMKLAGGKNLDQMNIDEFFKQADEYEKGGDTLDSIYKILNIAFQSHPFPVLRLKELKKWIDKGDYDKILKGEYPKRGEKSNFFNDFKASNKQYQEDMKESEDPIAKGINDIGREFEKAAKNVNDFFDNIFNNKE